jgi:hypothetical protein
VARAIGGGSAAVGVVDPDGAALTLGDGDAGAVAVGLGARVLGSAATDPDPEGAPQAASRIDARITGSRRRGRSIGRIVADIERPCR